MSRTSLLDLMPRQLKIDRMGPLTVPVHALHAMALRYGEEAFAKKGQCKPTFLIAIKTDVLWLEVEWENADHRALVYRLISDYLRATNAHAYSYISEVWIATVNPAENPEDIDVLPSDRPENERDEMLWVASFGSKGDEFSSRYLITPSSRPNRLAFLGPRVEDDYDLMVGMAWNLFKQEGLR
jgi:hypothetical protein